MTNEVVQDFTANTLLALGVSPAMVIGPKEASQFAAIVSVLLVNVDTLTRERATAIRAAVGQTHHTKTLQTLDPVAVGALEFRHRLCLELLSLQPVAIRSDASEILALAGMNDGGRGVDTTGTAVAALPVAQALARQTGTTIVVTGKVDYVTDGQRTICVDGGDSLITRVAGTGCTLLTVIAASCTLRGNRLDNVASACSWIKQTGQIATGRSNEPGNFVPAFLDALYNLNAQEQA